MAAINILYKPLGVKPTLNPLIHRLRCTLIHNRTTHPIQHSQSFNLLTLTKLFIAWGDKLSLNHLHAKLITLLCMLSALHMSAVILPHFADTCTNHVDSINSLIIPVIRYKNDKYGKGNTITIFQCSNPHLCLVMTFKEWHCQTMQVHNSRIMFETFPPYNKLSANCCTAILKGVAEAASLDTCVFTACTFHKSGVMAGINTDINPNAIFCLGGWRNPNTFWSHHVTHTIPSTYTDLLFDVLTQLLSDSDNNNKDKSSS